MSNETKTAGVTAAAGKTANENGARVRRFYGTLDKLDQAVIKQLGGECRNREGGRFGECCEIDEDTAQTLADVSGCSCGAAGGFSGFIYYTETREFTAANRAEIVARLREQIDEGLFTDENGKPRGVVGAVMSFNCLKDEDPSEIEEEAARVLFGSVDDIRGGELDRVANALAWAALEDLAFRLDGQEIESDEGEGRAE